MSNAFQEFMDRPEVRGPVKKVPKVHVKYFRSLGLAYFTDTYDPPFAGEIVRTHNLVLGFIRIQVKVKKTTVVTSDGSLKRVKER
jgi:hypothetical protein